MKSKKLAAFMRGIAALTASILVLSTIGTGLANTYRNALDGFLGTESYVTLNNEDGIRFQSDYSTIEEMAAAAKAIAIREGEEGTVVMKNDNGALPLNKEDTVVLFGLAAYAPFINAGGDLKGNNEDAVDLLQALKDAGVKINEEIATIYMDKFLNKHIEMVPNRWTGEEVPTTVYDNIFVNAPGDMTDYKIVEIAPDRFEEFEIPTDWSELIEKDSSVGICVPGRRRRQHLQARLRSGQPGQPHRQGSSGTQRRGAGGDRSGPGDLLQGHCPGELRQHHGTQGHRGRK